MFIFINTFYFLFKNKTTITIVYTVSKLVDLDCYSIIIFVSLFYNFKTFDLLLTVIKNWPKSFSKMEVLFPPIFLWFLVTFDTTNLLLKVCLDRLRIVK